MSWLDDFQVQIAQQVNEAKGKIVQNVNQYLQDSGKEALTKLLPTKEANYGNKNEADLVKEAAIPQVAAQAAINYGPYILAGLAAWFLLSKKRRG